MTSTEFALSQRGPAIVPSRRTPIASFLAEMRHYFGGEQLHATHDPLMWDSPTRIEPADSPIHFEIFVQPSKAIYTSTRAVENRHRLAHAIVGEAAGALGHLADMRRHFLRHGRGLEQ